MDCISSDKLKGIKIAPLEESATIEEAGQHEMESSTPEEELPHEEEFEHDMFQEYQNFLNILNEERDMGRKSKVVEKIRLLLKDDEEARIYMGANGFVKALLQFLESAVHERNVVAQDCGAMALFNLAVNNNRFVKLLNIKLTCGGFHLESMARLVVGICCLRICYDPHINTVSGLISKNK